MLLGLFLDPFLRGIKFVVDPGVGHIEDLEFDDCAVFPPMGHVGFSIGPTLEANRLRRDAKTANHVILQGYAFWPNESRMISKEAFTNES